MDDQWKISAYDPMWKEMFEEIAGKLRQSLGELAVRIDHVGSTAVPGLDAKPIVDIQISVANLKDLPVYRPLVEQAGFLWRPDNPDRTKLYFRERPGGRRTHLHLRQSGSFSEQLTLLFRDYLRTSSRDRERYAREKHRLMALYRNERAKYVEGKGPIVWDILQKAHLWAQQTGWQPGAADRLVLPEDR